MDFFQTVYSNYGSLLQFLLDLSHFPIHPNSHPFLLSLLKNRHLKISKDKIKIKPNKPEQDKTNWKKRTREKAEETHKDTERHRFAHPESP